jgi:predicted deacylase
MSLASPIESEVDFGAEGKHQGFLRLPHSVHRSAYGFIPIPVVSIRRNQGPKVVLMAGNHGDEYEGQVALTELARELEADDVDGQVIILPAANTPAAVAGLRTSPIDDGNLNRSFPGDPGGSPTQVIAHYLEHVVFDGIDYLLDLHSGGTSLVYLPTALVKWGISEADNDIRRGLLKALGLPFALVFEARDDGPFASSAAARRGGVGITAELGGGGMVSPPMLRLIRPGLKRYLKHVGVCRNLQADPPEHEPTILTVEDHRQYVFARSAGLFEPAVELGERVEAGQLAARIHVPEQPWRECEEVRFEDAGIVICTRALARTETGDCLFQLGTEPRRG